ncbi:alpha-(1,3)-fucosyltransferase B-like [Pectinophora gossypiella]|uniref:alpha-(1,3)-fucosyltransferase B-like n=1 Tax=Pectinophora gossypiella TaxID=13191 RepID=UPI00214E8765|nr:alpha-(1,3)-fucosyltransferase B-like [Pectinophora gossypiella]
MQSDCDTATERDDYVKNLMEFIPVDSYGVCLRNKELPFGGVYKYSESDGANRNYLNNLFDDQLLSFMAKYKFIVSIENGICNDYVTEKLWRPLEIGVVPIYYGSPLIRDWLPNNKSAILLEDFPTPELLSQHLHYLLNNDTAYEEYLEHKTLGLIANQRLIHEATEGPNQSDFNEMMQEFQCFVCGRLYGRNNSEVQTVTRDHYDCPLPYSALTQSVNPDNKWVKIIADAEESANRMYEEVLNSTLQLRVA